MLNTQASGRGTNALGSGGNAASVLGAAAAGAALMYFLDPARGPARRGEIANRLGRARTTTRDAAATTGRDLRNRAQGAVASARSRFQGAEASDDVVAARVRSAIGRHVSHPAAITVSAEQGRVTLRGPVLAHEVEGLLGAARKVRGVTDVANELEVHERPDGIPALQGDGTPRAGDGPAMLGENWPPAARIAAGLAGGALALYGTRRRGAAGSLLGLGGLAMVARGVTNRPLTQLAGVGGRRGVADIDKTVNVDAPVADVFGFFTEWEAWPRWMSHVRSVTASGPRGAVGERTHWVVDGPAGTTVEWDAETTDFRPQELVAWKSVEGSIVDHAGRLFFAPNPDGTTRVQVQMSYNPPAGVAGHAVAKVLGRDPKQQMDDDLMRLKNTIETGRPPRDAAAAERR